MILRENLVGEILPRATCPVLCAARSPSNPLNLLFDLVRLATTYTLHNGDVIEQSLLASRSATAHAHTNRAGLFWLWLGALSLQLSESHYLSRLLKNSSSGIHLAFM